MQINTKFIIYADASHFGLSAVLAQEDSDGQERPVLFSSKAVTKAQRLYNIFALELAALVHAAKENSCWLITNSFEVRSHHLTLKYLNQMRLCGSNRVMRWIMFLCPFRFTVTHVPGAKLTVADALSRIDHDQISRETKKEDENENSEDELEPYYCASVSKCHMKQKEWVDIYFGNQEIDDATACISTVAESRSYVQLPTAEDF